MLKTLNLDLDPIGDDQDYNQGPLITESEDLEEEEKHMRKEKLKEKKN
jgi:hypothetical protein